VPSYHIEDSGPDHAKVFTATCIVQDEAVGRGSGPSKKAAEQEAAEQAYGRLTGRGA
jgi:ribonuclease-3